MSKFRKGQVFLLVTILVVSFMIGISTVLLDIQRSDYNEPAPDAFETFEAWEVTYDSLIDIMDVYLAKSTGVSGEPVTITPQLDNLELYLTNKGITNNIELISGVSYTPISVTPTKTESVSVSAEFSIYLSSIRGTTIQQNVILDIVYTLDSVDPIDAPDDTVYLYKTVNGERQFLSGATFTSSVVSTFTDQGNGSYDHTVPGGETITVTTPSNVIITITN